MDFQIEEKSAVERHVTLTLPVASVKEEEERAFAMLSQKVKLKGFRPGKVPRKVLVSMYGRKVHAEAIDKLVQERLPNLLEREPKMLYLSQPRVDEESGDAVVISFDIEIKPTVEAKGYLGLEVPPLRLEVSDAQLKAELDMMRENQRQLEAVEGRELVELGDFVVFDFAALGSGPLAEFKGENQLAEVAAEMAPLGLSEGLVGAKLGETKLIEVSAPAVYPHAPRLAGTTFQMNVTVREIKRKVVPELDDDFARDTGLAETLADLEEAVRNRIIERMRKYGEQELHSQLLAKLREANPFDLPRGFLHKRAEERVIDQARFWVERGIPAAQVEQLLGGSGERVIAEVTVGFQNELLLDAIADREQIESSDDLMKARMEMQATRSGQPLAKIQRMYQAPEMKAALAAETRREATLKYLVANAKFVEPAATPTPTPESAG